MPAAEHGSRFEKAWGRYQTACARPALRRVLFGLTAGMIADQGFLVAVALYAHSHGGAAMVGAVALGQMVLAAVAAPLFGRRAARRSCRTVLRSAASVQAALMLVTALTIVAGASAACVVILASAGAVAAGASRPVRFALLPWLATSAEELEAANVASSSAEGLSYFAGPALAGLSVTVSGPAGAMVVTAGIAITAAVTAHRLPVIPAATAEPAAGRLVDGFAVLRRHASTVTTLAVTQTFVRGLLNVLVVAAALELMHTGDSGVALLQAVLGVGGVVGSLAAATAARRDDPAPRLAVALVAWGIPLTVVGLLPHPAVAGAALLVIGLANVFVDVNAVTLLQRVLPGHSGASSFASLECLFLLSVGTGSMAGGVLAERVGPRAALVLAGLVLPLAVVIRLHSLLAIGRAVEGRHLRSARMRQLPSLGALPVAALDLLTEASQEVVLARGSRVGRPAAGDVYLIVRGEASVIDDDVEMGRVSPGQLIGDDGASVIALEELVVMRIPAPAYLEAMASSPEASVASARPERFHVPMGPNGDPYRVGRATDRGTDQPVRHPAALVG